MTNRPYRGFNALLLGMIGAEFKYPLFMTFNQAKQLDAHVSKGSKGLPVIFWKKLYYSAKNSNRIMPEELNGHQPDDLRVVPLLRYFTVFNIDCIEGIEFNLPGGNYNNNPIERCEQIIQNMPNRPALIKGGDQPLYNHATDVVKVPDICDFKSEAEYYAALFHEIAHSTGHASRLNRATLTTPATFGSKTYCMEELIAEMASCFLCNETGIMDQIIDNSVAYLKNWHERLTGTLLEDKRFFIKAAAEAQKAADYILNRFEVATQEIIQDFEDTGGI